MSTPEIIYLIRGEYDGEQGMVWCDCAAPDSYCDPDEAVKYVRADTLPLPVLSRFPPEGEGMPRYGLHWDGPTKPLSVPMDCGYWTPWHLASAENKRLQTRVTSYRYNVEMAEILIEGFLECARSNDPCNPYIGKAKAFLNQRGDV